MSIDADMNVHAIAVTGTEVSASDGMDAVLPADVPVERVIADGAYYRIERTQALSSAGVQPIIPPPPNAIVNGGNKTRWHDQIVEYIQKNGIYALYNKHCYGQRSLVSMRCVSLFRV